MTATPRAAPAFIATPPPPALLFTYRAVPDAALAEYVTAWESDVGRWFSGVWRKAYLTTIAAAARRFAEQMARALATRPSPDAVR